MLVYFYIDFNLSHVLDPAAGPCGNNEDVRPAARTGSNRSSSLHIPSAEDLRMTTFLRLWLAPLTTTDNMVFSKIRGIHLRDFSSISSGGGTKESESEEDNTEETTEDFSDVITDNLGDIGRSDLQ